MYPNSRQVLHILQSYRLFFPPQLIHVAAAGFYITLAYILFFVLRSSTLHHHTYFYVSQAQRFSISHHQNPIEDLHSISFRPHTTHFVHLITHTTCSVHLITHTFCTSDYTHTCFVYLTTMEVMCNSWPKLIYRYVHLVKI